MIGVLKTRELRVSLIVHAMVAKRRYRSVRSGFWPSQDASGRTLGDAFHDALAPLLLLSPSVRVKQSISAVSSESSLFGCKNSNRGNDEGLHDEPLWNIF